nr:kinesin-like protein KIN-UA isoform X2 [Ipomoea batatas]GME18762.1 kinesin-like protein KIN-UA isoform X2 [Ipomoea batatas]
MKCICGCIWQNVLDGYNGTAMAYGQTGTGKTCTLGRLGEEGTADRGIMVSAMEDILAEISLETETVSDWWWISPDSCLTKLVFLANSILHCLENADDQ